jgi:hypothetical protein
MGFIPAQALSAQRRLDHKPSPNLDDPALMREIIRLFKQDLSPDQISDRLGTVYPDQPVSDREGLRTGICFFIVPRPG